MKKVLSQVEQVARTDSTVLLLGETGTGKELLARAIHNLSGRKGRPLVTVNCASLPPTLIESELFGRERGAYTGAMTTMAGRFEIANGSTLFLDEIGELPLELQSKLLGVLEKGTFERLGSTKTLHVNVRIIAATNRDIAQEVKEGKFRRDLYYRLNVFPIEIPPLRERPEDIPLMVWTFVKEFQKRMGKEIESIPKKDDGSSSILCLAGQRQRTQECHRTRHDRVQRQIHGRSIAKLHLRKHSLVQPRGHGARAHRERAGEDRLAHLRKGRCRRSPWPEKIDAGFEDEEIGYTSSHPLMPI